MVLLHLNAYLFSIESCQHFCSVCKDKTIYPNSLYFPCLFCSVAVSIRSHFELNSFKMFNLSPGLIFCTNSFCYPFQQWAFLNAAKQQRTWLNCKRTIETPNGYRFWQNIPIDLELNLGHTNPDNLRSEIIIWLKIANSLWPATLSNGGNIKF